MHSEMSLLLMFVMMAELVKGRKSGGQSNVANTQWFEVGRRRGMEKVGGVESTS
jgi:hypothetical protein